MPRFWRRWSRLVLAKAAPGVSTPPLQRHTATTFTNRPSDTALLTMVSFSWSPMGTFVRLSCCRCVEQSKTLLGRRSTLRHSSSLESTLEDVNSFYGELEETTRTPSYYIDEDYPAGPDVQQPPWMKQNRRGSESSTLHNDVYVWCYTLLVVHARKEQE